jgi:hypothetical protein
MQAAGEASGSKMIDISPAQCIVEFNPNGYLFLTQGTWILPTHGLSRCGLSLPCRRLLYWNTARSVRLQNGSYGQK